MADPLQVLLVAAGGASRADSLLGEDGSGTLKLARVEPGDDALARIAAGRVDACVVDLPGEADLAPFIARASRSRPEVPIVVVGAPDSPATGAALEAGAAARIHPDELTTAALESVLRHAIEQARRRRAEACFEALIENGQTLVSIIGPDGALRYLSPSLSRILGYEPGEKRGTEAVLEVHPEDRPRVESELGRLLQTPSATARLQYRVRHHDGGWRVLDTFAVSHLDDPAIHGVVVSSWDVTEHVERDRRVRFQAELLGAVGEAVMATDLEGQITYWNAAAERLYGWSAEEALGRPVMEVTPTDASRDQAREIMERLQRGESWFGELEMRRKDGSSFTALVTDSPIIDAEGRLIGVIGISSDITGLKRTEAELEERVKELRTLYRAQRVIDQQELPLEERLREFVTVIPEGWLYPEATEARITVADRRVATPGFRETPWQQSEPVRWGGQEVGRLEVVLTEQKPPADEGPFLEEERELLAALASALGERLERDRVTLLHERTLESLDEAVLVIDTRDSSRTILEANAAAEWIFGYAREELVGNGTERLHVSTESFERYARESLPSLLASGTFTGSFPMRRKDGTVFEAEQRTTWLDPATGLEGGVVSVVRDVSKRKRAEQKLRESEERFRQIAESIDDVFWVTSPDWSRVEYVSPAYRDIWGRPPEELYDDAGLWLEALLPSDRHRFHAQLERHPGEPYEWEYRIVRPDGEIRWILDRAFPVHNAAGEVERVVGVAKDVTDRIRAEERFAVLSRELTDAISVVGTDAIVRFTTPTTEAVFGYAPAEFEGRLVFDFIHEEDEDQVRALFRDVVHRPGAIDRLETRIITKSGEVRFVEAVTRNLIDHPAIEGIVVTTRDVTEQRLLADQLRQSQKMEAVGRLAGGIAHDFNNLLTVIRSQSDLLLMDLEDPDLVHEIETIRESADRAARLTSQLLAFSRDQVLLPRVIDLNEVVRGMGRLIDRVMPEHIRIVRELQQDLPAVEVDPSQLEQIVLNLAINARDAMPGGGTLTLRTGLVEAPQPEVFPDLPDGPCVMLEIADTGTGMDEETSAKVFEPFFTTKGPTQGTGLGLSVVYGVVKQSGGAIHVDSEPEVGTTFSLCFPATTTPAAEPEPARPRTRPLQRESDTRTVLLVEDDEGVRRVTRKILERAGLEVVAVEDGEAGLRLVEERQAFDLLVTDLVLPGVGGRDLVDRVREICPELPVVVISGYAEDAPGRHGRPLPEAAVFLEKPFTPDGLVQVVRDSLGG